MSGPAGRLDAPPAAPAASAPPARRAAPRPGHRDGDDQRRGVDQIATDDRAPVGGGRRTEALVEGVEVGAGRAGDGDEGVPGSSPHGGEVAQVDHQRLPSEVGERRKPKVGVDACDDRVGGQQDPGGRGCRHHGGVVADPHLASGGRLAREGGEVGGETVDGVELAAHRYCPVISGTTRSVGSARRSCSDSN
jgi:hypothetical protein